MRWRLLGVLDLYQLKYPNSPSHKQPLETSHPALWLTRYPHTFLKINESTGSPFLDMPV